jgi:hypothetical protein
MPLRNKLLALDVVTVVSQWLNYTPPIIGEVYRHPDLGAIFVL